jgi:hypothetical protein
MFGYFLSTSNLADKRRKAYNVVMLEYSTIKEMIMSLESCFTNGQKVISAHQENNNYILTVDNGIKVKLKMPQ